MSRPYRQDPYLHGLDIIAQQNSVTGWSYFGYDGLGSTRFLTDASGVPTYAADYDLYGCLIRR